MDSAAALWSANISHKCINFPFSTKRRGKIVKKLSEWSSRIEHYHQDSETAGCGVDEKPTWNLRNAFSFIWHLFSSAIPFNIFNSSFTALYDQILRSRASEDSFILTTIPSWAFEWNIKELKLNTSSSIIPSYFLDQSSSWAEKVRRRQNRKLKMSEKRDCLGNFSLSIIKSPEFVLEWIRKIWFFPATFQEHQITLLGFDIKKQIFETFAAIGGPNIQKIREKWEAIDLMTLPFKCLNIHQDETKMIQLPEGKGWRRGTKFPARKHRPSLGNISTESIEISGLMSPIYHLFNL